MEELFNQLISVGTGLSILAGAWFIWLLSGIANNLFSTKKWSWKRMFEDIVKTLVMAVSILSWVVLINAIDWYTSNLGLDVSALLDGANVVGLVTIIIGGSANYAFKAFRNFATFIGEKHVAQVTGEQDYGQIAKDVKETVKEIADRITPKHTSDAEQTDEVAPLEEGAVEVGQGSDVNPLSRRLADGDNCNGKGWQCSKYAWYLGTGIVMNYAPHPDYGPCNGNAMVDYLINKLGWVRCGKINGAIFSYNAGAYGHTGMVVDAANNIVNDANWEPLVVSTHFLNLDAVGAIYCCPKGMLQPTPPAPTPAPTPTPAPKPQPAKPDNKPTKKNPTIEYTYKQGDTFGQVIMDLGLNTSHGLWDPVDGDVAYYNKQLAAQGITGNIPVGTTIKLTPRA